MRRVGIIAGLVAVLLAGVLSYYASSQPDGLNKVAGDQGIASQEQESATSNSPLAGYSLTGVEDERTAGAVAGLIGLAATAAAGFGVFYLIRARRP